MTIVFNLINYYNFCLDIFITINKYLFTFYKVICLASYLLVCKDREINQSN